MSEREASQTNLRGRRPQFARLRWDADGAPHSLDFEDRYFSRAGALEESSHVFLEGCRLPERWQNGAAAEFTVAEAGFGSGLNFLNAWRLQLRIAPALRLHYIGLESRPLREEQMRRALGAHPQLKTLAERLLRAWHCPTPGWHEIEFAPVDEQNGAPLRLSLLIADVADGLKTLLAAQPPPQVDAWFLDGFAPARNPEMWSEELFNLMRGLSAADCSFATYTAAGRVRRALEKNGFEARRAPGYGDKKEMLCGVLTGRASVARRRRKRPANALVIGGGLAGCASAAALARRGLEVTLLEKNAAPAEEASGQPCSILYPGLSASGTPAARFSLAAWHFAVRSYRALFERGPLRAGEDGAFCGMLQLHCNERTERRNFKLAELYSDCPELLRLTDAAEAGALSGVPQRCGGLFYPAAGWLRAAALCAAWLQDARIRILTGQAVQRLECEGDGGWAARDADGVLLARAERAVLAAGAASAELLPQHDFGLQTVRGQSSSVPATEHSAQLRIALCHQGYVSPAIGPAGDRRHALGATHEPLLKSAEPRADSHRHNLKVLAQQVPALFEKPPAAAECEGTVGFRCIRPGRAPLAGAAPGAPGLFLNLAHGGRGLCLIPLCAEIVAAGVCGETPPTEAGLLEYAAPGA